MRYLLTQKEYDALTPVKGLQERNEALEAAKVLILELSGFPCGETYCDKCPIGNMEDNTSSKHICIQMRQYSK